MYINKFLFSYSWELTFTGKVITANSGYKYE